nr:polyneuridine-aldehyde esterase-like [Coffea arabica]
MVGNRSHFLLVHGACLGAWSWYKLVTLLEEAGHKVTALDLAASGRNQERIQDVLTIDDYHKPLFSFMDALSPEEKVILVGHSMGGYAVSSAMERYPEKIDFAVFVSAHMLGPELPLDKLDEWDLKLATLLVRPTKFFTDQESNQQLRVTEEKYGSVRRAYFIGGSDVAMPADVQRWMVENNPPDVAKEIKEADHMVMISKAQELCTNLLEITSMV